MTSVRSRTVFVHVAPALFVFLWSTGYVGARFGLPFADPFTLTSIRFAIVTAILTLVIVARRGKLPRTAQMWGHLAVSGLLIHACFIGGVFTAIDVGVNISIAALIAGTQPLLTAVIAVLFLGETLSARQWCGFVIGFMGLAMVVLKTIALDALPLVGLLGCLVGLCGITGGTLYQKRFVVGLDLFTGSAIQFACALIPCTLLAFLFESREIQWNLTVTLTLAWLCLVLSIGAISILLFLIRAGAASRVSSLFYLVPPVTAVQGYWFFGEKLDALQIVGIAVAALGVALINYQPAARQRAAAP
ncbi:MAG: drug/metabolite transporter (DMT)-like permease [Gammaproteobacteria bacterium]|jgi:drug/metabolite transporter (DMT)-like permease